MTSLAELQDAFREAMFGDRAAVAVIGDKVRPTKQLDGESHVHIYRQSVLGTLTASLVSVFPVTRRLVGEQFFDAMAARFIPSAPSQSPDLADFGADFPAFIGNFEPAAELPYLPDVAVLEWAWHRAFHAADEGSLDAAELREAARGSAERIVFSLPVSARLIRSAYPIHRIWRVNQPGYAGDDRVDLAAGKDRLIVWRPSVREIRIDELQADEWQLLTRIETQATLAQLADMPNLADLLPRCAERGWLGGFATA